MLHIAIAELVNCQQVEPQRGAQLTLTTNHMIKKVFAMRYGVIIPALLLLAGTSQVYANDGACLSYQKEVTLSGYVQVVVNFGPPGYGETPEDQKTDRRDVEVNLLLDQPVCTIGTDSAEAEKDDMEIALTSNDGTNNSLRAFAGEHITVTGVLQHSDVAEGATLVLISTQVLGQTTDRDTNRQTTLNDSQKREMLTQFKQFQQALKNQDISTVESFFTFPLSWETEVPWQKGDLQDLPVASLKVDKETFEQHFSDIAKFLNPLVNIDSDLQTLTTMEYRENSLTAEAQKRKYYSTGDDDSGEYLYYYQEGDQKHYVKGVCDNVVSTAEFYDSELSVTVGSAPNKQIPGGSEYCEHQRAILDFVLINNRLHLKDGIGGAD
ncbi:hypothetical protein PJ142_004354 [Salmonella enterica]|nr:hypothetical protein [Salmonella enterica]EKJ8976851.1 hypothetical protein [Salmonella enterica]EKJ9442466.1 hypothetical protein [Salmonella enterica]EKJ9451980.1 hypothetical protein [Salmonella enterica]EKJ9690171.1 hypothetical protein [Salmonella enterica]